MQRPIDNSIKDLLSNLAEKVKHLPEHLQASAFAVLLQNSISQQPGKKQTTLPLPGEGTTFADYYHSFPSELKELEKLLIAGSFAETQSDDRTYTIESAHSLLKEIGIELSNSGVFARQLVSKKLAIVISKLGKKTFKYRISLQGHNALKSLKEKQG